MFAHSHLAGPTQQLGVLNAEPEPPRSQPRDENSAKIGSIFSVVRAQKDYIAGGAMQIGETASILVP